MRFPRDVFRIRVDCSKIGSEWRNLVPQNDNTEKFSFKAMRSLYQTVSVTLVMLDS